MSEYNSASNNNACNQNQISKTLPLKKRRTYVVDTPTSDMDNTNTIDNDNHRSTTNKHVCNDEDHLNFHLGSVNILSPPSSPHVGSLRKQQHAYLLANPSNNHYSNVNTYSNYDFPMPQKVLTHQYFDKYRMFTEQQYTNPQHFGYVDGKRQMVDVTVDEHFRKSLGNNYEKFHPDFLTPNQSSDSSPIERTPVNSIDEHFARSLGNSWPLEGSPNEMNVQTEAFVDDHFAKALGAKTWQNLKGKS